MQSFFNSLGFLLGQRRRFLLVYPTLPHFKTQLNNLYSNITFIISPFQYIEWLQMMGKAGKVALEEAVAGGSQR